MIESEDWKDLNEAYYELYGRLFENMELVDEKFYALVSKKLLESYEEERALLERKNSIAYKQELFETKVRCGRKIPRTFLWWRNRAAKTTARELALELGAYFRERDAAIERAARQTEQGEPEYPDPSSPPEGQEPEDGEA